jgi:hypothetical protein
MYRCGSISHALRRSSVVNSASRFFLFFSFFIAERVGEPDAAMLSEQVGLRALAVAVGAEEGEDELGEATGRRRRREWRK